MSARGMISRSASNTPTWSDSQVELQARQLFEKNNVDQMRLIEANLRYQPLRLILPLTLA